MKRGPVRPGKYKLPDLCIVQGPRPGTLIFERPPLVAIEILSPEDRPLRWIGRRMAGFRRRIRLGSVDPETPDSILHTASGRVSVIDSTLRIPGSPIEILLNRLDEE